ncbi:carotenoid biosynthesis protein [Maribellus sp. YY47]|uniref:carotenoid biosynthesis protein n=1 Tax=Maribellus sp. YY47 TaxID=2929486 RepID=UPI002000EA70|nr:carotenoid biosynthesis protein [Maribellus sp. YY47]MCK3684136.1 carotenoid biosynthesis protein [Maribellus sp. YY47]
MTHHQNISRFTERYFSGFVVFFFVFYTVGIIGLSMAATRPLFIGLTPLALLLSSFAVMLFHRDHRLKVWLIFVLIYLLGLSVEMTGVQSGLIFGNYKYGNGLGWKVFETPLIIGLNWLLLVYAATSLSSRLKIARIFQVLIAAFILLAYDLILEQIAPKLDMWSWDNDIIPLQNYLAWFALAFAFSVLLVYSKTQVNNKLAPVVLLCQFLFFVVLNLILR